MTPSRLNTLNDHQLDRIADLNPKGSKLKLEILESFLGDTPVKNWIIKGIIACGETTAWVGPPGSLKSALLAELTICMTSQMDFHCMRAKRRAGVIYFALERADLVRRRLSAHCARLGIDGDLPLAVITGMIDLANPSVVNDVLDAMKRFQACFGIPAECLIFDTFSKLIAAGGGDEDKARDQGRVFANVQRIKDATGAHIALVGHTGKDEARGARGSNAILGDVDVMITIGGEAIKTATVTKANDMPEGPLFSFKSETHQFGTDEDGDPITVNIVSGEPVETNTGGARGKLRNWPKGLRLVRDCIATAITEVGTAHAVAGDGPTVRAVEVPAARAIHDKRYVSTGDGDRTEAERKAWRRNLKEALSQKLVCGETIHGKELIWLADRDKRDIGTPL